MMLRAAYSRKNSSNNYISSRVWGKTGDIKAIGGD